MAEEKSLFQRVSEGLQPQQTEPLPRTVGAFDYITDIPLGAIKGVSQAVQGLVSLGALPIDYIFDTNLTKNIDNLFEKITPETDTVVGDVTSILGQFGLPAGVAVKVANGMLKLSKASQLKKLSSFKKADGTYDITGAGGELAKRAGYYGSIGAVTDFAVSTPGDITTFSETFGFGEAYKGKELEGRDRAVADFKEKIRFGAEGALLGAGAVTALPVAGTLGVKYGIMPAAKYIVAPTGKAVFNVADKVVFNPVSKLIGSEIVGKGTKATGEFITNQASTLREKLGIPKVGDWKKMSDSPMSPLKERFFRKGDKFKNLFTDPLDPATAEELRKSFQFGDADRKNVARFIKDIDTKLKDIANSQAIKLPKILRDSKFQYPSKIMDKSDIMLSKMNDDMFDYIKAKPGQDAGLLNNLDPSIRDSAKSLKNLLIRLNKKYGKMLSESNDKSLEELGFFITKNGGAYLKQVFSAMKNKSYEFDKTLVDKAKTFFKEKTIPKVDEYKRLIDVEMQSKNISREEATNFVTDGIISNLQNTLLTSNRNPESLFRTVTRTFAIPTKDTKVGVDALLESGVRIQDLMKDTIKSDADAVIGAFLTPVKSWQEAVVDTALTTTKQVYKKDFFDRTAKIGLERGFLFRSREEAALKGYKNSDTLIPISQDMAPGKSTYTPFDSDMFKLGVRIGEEGAEQAGPLFALPEIANAIKGQDEYLTRLFDLPGYKLLMSVKAAGQIGKTVFSPMTQIRNVSTASFFALASGLIGGRASLTDSFKLLADDLFPGKFVKASDVAKRMEDLIQRGVVDQNIEVNEIKNILEKAKKGSMSMQTLIENPIVKRAFDLYQGGDNVWKIYADKFYQSALGDAFKYVSPQQAARGVRGDRAIRENMIDWYRTVAKQDDIAEELASINSRIINAKTTSEAAGLSQQFNNLRSVGDISAYLVTNTIPTYSRVPRIIQNIRNLPLGNFIAFPAEILRTGTHLLTIGSRELMSSNPFIRQMGARRLLGASAVFGGTGAIISGTAEKLTGVDQEKMEAFKRSIAPDFQKNSTLIPLTKPDEKGEFKYFNFSYTNPYDSLTRPVNAILSAFSNGQLNEANLKEIMYDAFIYDQDTNAPGALTEFITPFVSESIGAGAIADLTIRGGRTKDGKIIYYPQDDIMEILDASFGHLIGQLEPGATRSARRVYQGVTGAFNDFGTQYDGATEFAALTTGLRVETAKPLNSLPFIISSYNKDTENIRNKFSRNVYRPNIDVRSRVGYMQEYLTDSYRSQSNLNRIIKDMVTIGVDEDTIEDNVQERFRNRNQTRDIMNGEFRAPNLSDDRFKTLLDRLEREDPIAAAKVESEIDEAIDIIEEIRDEVDGEELGLNPGFVEDRIKDLFTITPSVPTISDQQATLPQSSVIGTPVATDILQNQNIGQRYLGSDILRQIELAKLQGR